LNLNFGAVVVRSTSCKPEEVQVRHKLTPLFSGKISFSIVPVSETFALFYASKIILHSLITTATYLNELVTTCFFLVTINNRTLVGWIDKIIMLKERYVALM
jgi:hypothetical protein